MKKVGIIMGSDSDLPVVEKAISTLAELNIPTEVHVYSAHRTPIEARDFSVNARANGFGAIIAAAGKAAHLAGAIAANTTLPVIGIPVKSSTDARRHPCCHGCHRRSRQCRFACCTDHRRGRRGSGRPTGCDAEGCIRKSTSRQRGD